MPVRTVKTNLWPFSSSESSKRTKSAKKSSMTVSAAMSAAYKAGKASGDTGLFDSWLESRGLDDRSDTLKNRLRKEYERGHETNYGSGGASTEAHEQHLAAKGLKYKGYTIREVEGGYSTSLDRESVHDSVKDAKDFIDDHKRNPSLLRRESHKYTLFRGFGPDNLGSIIRTGNDLADLKDHAEYQQGQINENYYILPYGSQDIGAAVWKLTKKSANAGSHGAKLAQLKQKRTRLIKQLDSLNSGGNLYERKMADISLIQDDIDKLERKRKRNPESDSDSAFESFHGAPPKETVIVEEKIHEHEHLWNCGKLMEIVVDTLTGKEMHLEWQDNNDAPFLSASEDGKQLYIEGGDQELDLAAIGMDGERWVKDRMVIGAFAPPRNSRKWNLTYRTKKDFDKFEEIDYQHWLGEPSKELRNPAAPFLEYDPISKKLYISGGQYIIKKPVFGTSPGIEN
jgi:hypothetical protein